MISRFVPAFTVVYLSGLVLFAADKAPNPKYLALGDSVTFGLKVDVSVPIPMPAPPPYIGYPEKLAGLPKGVSPVINLSCPGQTSGSFYIANEKLAPEPLGSCRGWRQAGLPLHYDYPGTQLEA